MNKRGRGFSTNGPSASPRGRPRRNRGSQKQATAVPDSEEIFYDDISHGTPTSYNLSQNFDYAGFLILVEETYDCLADMDCYFIRNMPFSVFQHVMVNHLNLQILKIARCNFYIDIPDPTAWRHRNSCIPKPIFDYITHVSDTVTKSGITIKLNLPKIAVPQGPIGDIPSGTFGVINEHTHNVYECYISPLVTANRVIASMKKTPDYQPLPSAIFPSGLIPNENLLGYGAIDNLSGLIHQLQSNLDFADDDSIEGRLKICSLDFADDDSIEGRLKICSLDFPDNDSIEGRLKICSSLVHHVNNTMARMENKMKMVVTCSEIIPRSVLSNLCFVESCGTIKTSIVSRMDVSVHSHVKFSSITANQTNLECMHRRRVDNAVGPCYTAADGSVPAGWEATCNSNFEMDGIFGQCISDCPELRFNRFASYGAAATRKDVYKNFIAYNYFI